MTVRALSGFGWFLTGVVVAPACYLVSSQVASERARVEAVERAIAKARKDIRGLETEFDTRANLAQLERWNGDVMRYTAPTPQQFLASDTELTALRPLEGDGLAERYAAMVVPEGMPDVVRGTIETASDAVEAVAPAKPAAPKAEVKTETAVAVAKKAVEPVAKVAGGARDEAVAMLDRKLLKDSSFGDLMQGVKAEAAKVR